MNGVVVPWMAEIILLSYRAWKSKARPPLPGELAATFVVFGGCSFIPNKQVAAAAGWGFFVASALNILPKTIVPQYPTAAQRAAQNPNTNIVIGPNGIAPIGTVVPNRQTIVAPGVGTVQVGG